MGRGVSARIENVGSGPGGQPAYRVLGDDGRPLANAMGRRIFSGAEALDIKREYDSRSNTTQEDQNV